MTSKVNTQVKKALQLINKEGWPVDAAVEAAFTSVSKDITYEEFENLVKSELGE